MYLDRTGCAWRYLPCDFPPWQTVHGYFAAWRDDGTLARLRAELRAQVRAAAGRMAQPAAAVIDSQSVRAADTVLRATRGWDNAKKINGRREPCCTESARAWPGAGLTRPPGYARRSLRALKLQGLYSLRVPMPCSRSACPARGSAC